MGQPTQSEGLSTVIDEIDKAERQVSTYLATVKKLKDRLTRAKQDIGKDKPVTRLSSLVADLKAMPNVTGVPDVNQLAIDLERQLRSLGESYGSSFKSQLRAQCEAQGIPFRAAGDAVSIGPFALTIDAVKEVASLSYAKVPLATQLPLDPQKIASVAAESAARLLQAPSIQSVGGQIEEAMRVAITRQKKAARAPELRAELPGVYREMTYIRQAGGAKAGSDYSLPRFVVELKSLVQSDENTKGTRRFRLETAVLENAKDPRKSIFVPNDLSVGYGEGSYYQAIVLIEGS